MNEIPTFEDHIERQALTTINTITSAYLTFGETNIRYEEHKVRLGPLEPTPVIPVDHFLNIRLTNSLTVNNDNQLVRHGGQRKLTFTVLGEERERGSRNFELDGKHSAETWYGRDQSKETPVLAQATMAYNLHRLKWTHSTLALDGVHAGIQEIKSNDPSFFLDVAANLLGSRSMSVRRLGAITTELAVDSEGSTICEHGTFDSQTFTSFMRENGFTSNDVYKARGNRELATFAYKSVSDYVRSEHDPRFTGIELHCTSFDKDTRMDTTLFETEYTGFSPINPDGHAQFTHVVDPDTQEIGERSRAFDGRLRVYKYGGQDEVSYGEDPQSLGRVLRHMRRSSEIYIDIAMALFRDESLASSTQTA